MGFKRIAIAGASSVGTQGGWSWGTGTAILHALVDLKRQDPSIWDTIVVVSRLESVQRSSTEFALLAPFGVEVRGADYQSVESLQKAIQGTEIVLSCIAGPAAIPTLASNLLRASVATGTVRRFLPSEYSFDLEAPRNAPLLGDYHKRKVEHRRDVEKSGLEWTYVVTGSYLRPPSYIATLTTPTPTRPVLIRLDLSTPPPSTLVSGITVPDVALYVARLVTDPDESWSRNKCVRFLADEWSQTGEVELVREVSGKPVEVDWVEEKNASYFALQAAKGLYWVPKSEWDSSRYPDVKPRRLRDVVEEEWKRVQSA
ncbi:NAD(P)-binding protein [Gonapodya prolifera JEL478]|uniref:NAD(P)-binding protein n=1 Tax=Gonapodya prolifera (strain JEL478) TaxID=1344416 RepID=A0A139A1V5_GONPJ|nr:NAD(P)-binding protein [Gonapodya prolifera JEL478]|eukprot:KXS10766.1 NAD(P)-binding protein [Gonapodya prolifera JEL478]